MSNNAINTGKPIEVFNGGTTRATLANHGVVIGETANPVNVSNAGINGQLLLAATGGDPMFSTLTSFGGTVAYTPTPNGLNLEAIISHAGGGASDAYIFAYSNVDEANITGDGNPLPRRCFLPLTLFSQNFIIGGLSGSTPTFGPLGVAYWGTYFVYVQVTFSSIGTSSSWNIRIINGTTQYQGAWFFSDDGLVMTLRTIVNMTGPMSLWAQAIGGTRLADVQGTGGFKTFMYAYRIT